LLFIFPTSRRDNAREIFDAVEAKLGGFLLGEAILCSTISAFSLISFLLIGLPNAFVLALIAGVMELVPTVGPALGALPAILVASTIGVNKIILVLISATLIQLLENNLLVPRIMDKSVGVNPLITLLALAAFSSLFGLVGALLAVPLAAIIQLLINRFVIDRDETSEIRPEGRDYLSYLRLQAQEISRDTRRQVRNNEQEPQKILDQVEDSIEAVADDLDRILSQASVQEGNGL
jgi:predicted PurR-regulated permease PerM